MKPTPTKKLLIVCQVVDQDHPILGFFHGWILEFAKHFDRIEVICMQLGKYDLPDHVHVHSLGKETGKSKLTQTLRFYRYFARAFFLQKPDFVFFHMGAIFNILAAPFFLVRKLVGTSFYWWKTHGHINTEGRIALWFVDEVCTAIAASFPVKTRKRRVVGHAIDTDLFSLHTHTGNTQLKLLFIGRRSRSKRLEQVVAIARELNERSVDCTLTIIGIPVDQTYELEWQSQISNDVVSKIAIIDGLPHHELVAAYQAANIFLNPSDNDGLDKVVLEAMACGTIPLTANTSFADILTEYNLYMKKGDIAGYADRIVGIQTMSASEQQELSAQLRAVVTSDHSLATITERIFKI